MHCASRDQTEVSHSSMSGFRTQKKLVRQSSNARLWFVPKPAGVSLNTWVSLNGQPLGGVGTGSALKLCVSTTWAINPLCTSHSWAISFAISWSCSWLTIETVTFAGPLKVADEGMAVAVVSVKTLTSYEGKSPYSND